MLGRYPARLSTKTVSSTTETANENLLESNAKRSSYTRQNAESGSRRSKISATTGSRGGLSLSQKGTAAKVSPTARSKASATFAGIMTSGLKTSPDTAGGPGLSVVVPATTLISSSMPGRKAKATRRVTPSGAGDTSETGPKSKEALRTARCVFLTKSLRPVSTMPSTLASNPSCDGRCPVAADNCITTSSEAGAC